MKVYDLDTQFTFGKHSKKTVRQVVDIELSYIEWCAINLDHFFMYADELAEIKKIKPDFKLTDEATQKLSEKYDAWQRDLAKNDETDYEEEDTYDNYNGSYAQDVEGYSDQDIDDVFGGAPDAYWNID